MEGPRPGRTDHRGHPLPSTPPRSASSSTPSPAGSSSRTRRAKPPPGGPRQRSGNCLSPRSAAPQHPSGNAGMNRRFCAPTSSPSRRPGGPLNEHHDESGFPDNRPPCSFWGHSPARRPGGSTRSLPLTCCPIWSARPSSPEAAIPGHQWGFLLLEGAWALTSLAALATTIARLAVNRRSANPRQTSKGAMADLTR